MENTLWSENFGSSLVSFGIFLSNNAIDSMNGDRTRQLANANPTGPQPAIKTCVDIFCII